VTESAEPVNNAARKPIKTDSFRPTCPPVFRKTIATSASDAKSRNFATEPRLQHQAANPHRRSTRTMLYLQAAKSRLRPNNYQVMEFKWNIPEKTCPA
jgi:hypothetical protein